MMIQVSAFVFDTIDYVFLQKIQCGLIILLGVKEVPVSLNTEIESCGSYWDLELL